MIKNLLLKADGHGVEIYPMTIGSAQKHKTSLEEEIRIKEKGKINLPSYFTSFGVISSLEAFLRAKKNTEKRIENKKTKELSKKRKQSH